MRNLSIFLVFIFLFSIIHAQEPPEISIDSMLINIDQSDFSSGILYDRVYPWSDLTTFTDTLGISNKKHFEQSLLELYKASNEQKLVSYKTFRNYYTPDSLQNIVDIGILNVSYHELNYKEGNENDGALTIADDLFQKINNNKPAFLKKHAFIVSPLKLYVVGDEITYKFNTDFLVENTENKDLVNLVVDFDTGVLFTVIENGNFTNDSISISYSEVGYKTLTIYATFSDGSTRTTQSVLHVKLPAPLPPPLIEDGFINADIPYQGYDESTSFYGHLKYRIFYRTNHNEQIRKPIIIIDGFDPGDKRKIQDTDPHPNQSNEEHVSIEEMMTYHDNQGIKRELIPILRSLGYDVVIVNHPTYWRNGVKIDGGADYIERNALTHVKLYQYLNTLLAQNNSNEELVIIGPSMGGQISRYALAYMEKHGIAHNTRLWVSIDSPHLGANIPVGVQTLLNLLNDYTNSVEAEDFVENQLGSAAAKQQLIEQHKTEYVGPFQTQNVGQQYLNGKTISQGFSQNNGHPFFIQYYNNLFNNGTPNSKGYPQNLRKIALVNGALKNTKGYENPYILNGTGISGTPTLNYFAASGEKAFKIEGDANVIGHITTLETYFMPSFGANHKIAYFKKKKWSGWSFFDRYIANNNSRGNMDNVPGGWFPTQRDLAYSIENSVPCEWIIGQICVNDWDIKNLKHVNSFIPTISSLGFFNPEFNWSQELDRNLVCTGEIPFDSYFGPEKNEQHTSFTQESIAWLLAELAGNPQPPSVYLNANDMNGPTVICSNDMVTYDFDTCKSPSVEEWEVSNNLVIVTSGDFSITVEPVSSTTNGAGFIKAVYDNHSVQKNIWIGKPSSPTFLNGPLEVHTGSMVSYNGGGSSGATSYEWILPYPFDENNDVHNPIDFNGSNWQTWPVNTAHNSHIFTGLGGHNGLVQLVGVNQCGDGGSIHLNVVHDNGGTCTTCYDPVMPVPNEADSHFNLDFSEYPPGTYYIYIYDGSSNVMYEGTSTNVDKTVETINIPGGIYYLHIHDGNEVIIKQLVISH